MFTVTDKTKTNILIGLGALVILVDSTSYVMSMLSDLGILTAMYLIFTNIKTKDKEE